MSLASLARKSRNETAAFKPRGNSLRISEPGDALEREADRAAAEVARGNRVSSWSLSTMSEAHLQRQDSGALIRDERPKPQSEQYKEAASKLGEAFLKTDLGKKLEDAAKQAGEEFISTLPGKVIAGTAAVGAVTALAATHSSLPVQLPEIPLDKIHPGLKVKLTYEGPVDHPTKALVTFSYAPKAEKKSPLADSERYRAETARIAADQAKFRAGMRYAPGSPEDLQQKAEEKAMQNYIAHRYGTLPGFGDKPLVPAQSGGTGTGSGLTLPQFESPFKPKHPTLFDQKLELKPLSAATLQPGAENKEEPAAVQRKASDAGPARASADVVPRSAGRPLDRDTRAFMESKFGFDFSKVRVHTDANAAASAKAVNALAYTVGSDVVFGSGQYSPHTAEGRKLLAHELAHAVQQAGSDAQTGLQDTRGHERGRAARHTPPALTHTKPAIARQPANPKAEDSPSPEEQVVDQFDLLGDIQQQFESHDDVQKRGKRLIALFNQLEPDYARRVDKAITSGGLKSKFQRFPANIHKQLKAILAKKEGGTINQRPGVLGRGNPYYYIVRDGVTIDDIARYLSDDPHLAGRLESDNHIPHYKMLTAGTLVSIPANSATRSEAQRDIREDLLYGDFIGPSKKIDHSGDRSLLYDQVPLTKSEFASLKENQIQQSHGREAMKRIATRKADPKQAERNRELASQHPSAALSLLLPVSNLYVKDRSSEIHDPMLRMQYGVEKQGIEAGTNLGRLAGAAAADTAAAASFLPAAGEVLGPKIAFYGGYVYINAPSLYASAVLYGGAIMTGAALAAHIQKIRQKGLDASDIPQLAADLMPAMTGYLDASYFSGGTTGPGAPSSEPDEPDLVIIRPAQYDQRTGRISGSIFQRSTDQTFDCDMDAATGNGQITNRATRQVVGIVDEGQIRPPAAGDLPAPGQTAANAPAATTATVPRGQTAPLPTALVTPATAATNSLPGAVSNPAPLPTRPPAPALGSDETAPVALGGVATPSVKGPAGSKPPQKMLSSSELKGTGKLTSDADPKSARLLQRGKATRALTVYEAKKASSNPDDQAEVRMGERFAADGYNVHFRANDKGGDLYVDGVRTDVKNPRTQRIASAISSAAQQGADQVIIDGTTSKLTPENASAGIQKFEDDAMKYPKLRGLETIFIVEGDGKIFVYHRTTSLKKAH